MNKCNFEGNDVTLIESANGSLLDCGQKCSDHENCTHFSYSAETHTCSLKTGMRNEKDAVFSESSDCGLLKSKMVLNFFIKIYKTLRN